MGNETLKLSLSVKIHPDAIAMDQSDHADSRVLPCQQESFSISFPIRQPSLFYQRHCLDSSQERPWHIVGWRPREASVYASSASLTNDRYPFNSETELPLRELRDETSRGKFRSSSHDADLRMRQLGTTAARIS